MQSILLVGSVQAIFLSLLLVTKKSKSTPDFILVALLIFTAIPLSLYYLIYDDISTLISSSETLPSFMYFVNVPFIMTFTPSFYLYIKANVKPQKKFVLNNIIHFSPILIFIILTFIFIDFSSLPENNFNITKTNNHIIFLAFTPITLILAVFYIIKSFKLFNSFSKKLKQNFSYTEDIDLNWLKILLIIVTATWIILISTAIILGRMGEILSVYKLVLLTLSLLVFIVAFFGFKQTNIFINQEKNSLEDKNHRQKPSQSLNFNGDVKKLLDFMSTNKPYLENKLTIGELAKQMDFQTHYLSKLLNENMNQNFYEFINNYRVEEFKNQLNQNKNFTLIAIAYECGFNSKSSFNRIFKEFTGKTPSQYKKSLQ